jgi:hypothetical protein
MEPMKLLFNQKHYISSFKLLVSLIDTIAYLEYGDVKRNFQQWLDTYSEISKVEITSDEVYQLRNSLLHMTNLNSRDVLKKKHRRLSIAICKKVIQLSIMMKLYISTLQTFISSLMKL